MSGRLVAGGSIIAIGGISAIGIIEFVGDPVLANRLFLAGAIAYGIGLLGVMGGLYISKSE
jgi:hypothetical protein